MICFRTLPEVYQKYATTPRSKYAKVQKHMPKVLHMYAKSYKKKHRKSTKTKTKRMHKGCHQYAGNIPKVYQKYIECITKVYKNVLKVSHKYEITLWAYF